MPDGITDALTRRRLGGAVLLLAGIVVAAVVLWPGGGDEQPAARPTSTPSRIVAVPPLGLAFAHPTSWKRSVRQRVINVASPDGSVVLYFASPVAGARARSTKAATEASLRRQFAPAKVVNEGQGALGDRTASTFELTGRNGKGPIRALVLVDSTPYRTYVVTLLTGAKPSVERLREAREILTTVRLSKPVAANAGTTTGATTTGVTPGATAPGATTTP